MDRVESMKNVVIFVAIATILAVSGLGYTFIASETNRKSNENLNVEIQAVNSDLTSLQNRLTTLNSSLTQLSKSIGDLDADLQREKVNTQANVSSLSTQISNVRNNVSAIQRDISKIQTEIIILKSNVTSLSTQISDIKSGVSTIDTNIANLQSNVTALSTEIANIQNDVSTILTLIADLQSKVASLETRVSTLEAEKSIVIRINFVSFVPDATPPGGEDYLFDAEAEGLNMYAQARTGHSRFIKPRYLDLVIRNGTHFIGTQVTIKLYAYWHLDDVVIDIDPDPAHGRTIGTNPSGGYLTLSYTIGTVLQGTVNGNDDGYALDQYDAYLAYKIETLT